LNSNKSLLQIKEDYAKDFKGLEEFAEEESKPHNFLDIFADTDSDTDGETPQTSEEDEVMQSFTSTPRQDISLHEYRERFSTYSESQAALIEGIIHLSERDKLTLYKSNIMNLLSM
jgi:hypothetical protein